MDERNPRFYYTDSEAERVILVGVELPGDLWDTDESLLELERLVQTAGGVCVATLRQKLQRPNPKTLIGSGKVAELKALITDVQGKTVVFDEELSPAQQTNLEAALGKDIKVLDRCALILDIFGMHAKTSDGRLQVELAQLSYVLPRLKGMWSHLVGEQTRGGIGSRFGQGESQIEVDRRIIRKRIHNLKLKLERLEQRRQVLRSHRDASGIYKICLVGYTNAGKSTLLNLLCDAEVYVRDELFATLDPTTRLLSLYDGHTVTLTDTVGFIQKLPPTLIDAFRSTLSEVVDADLLLVVADAHDPHLELQLKAVYTTLKDIAADQIDSVLVLNKCDLLHEADLQLLRHSYPEAQCISALSGFGIAELKDRLLQHASKTGSVLQVLIPYQAGSLVNLIHERCRILYESYTEQGVCISLRCPDYLQKRLQAYCSPIPLAAEDGNNSYYRDYPDNLDKQS